MTSAPDDQRKRDLLVALRARVTADLEALTALQKQAQNGAFHEETRAETDKDTQAIEASYVARGLAQRVEEMRIGVAQLGAMRLRRFEDDPIAVGALVALEDDEGVRALYFLAPAGGGLRLPSQGTDIGIITPSSPLGRALIGKRVDDELELPTGGGLRALTIVAVS
jgi:transcription elongation GreA/GreB family factor